MRYYLLSLSISLFVLSFFTLHSSFFNAAAQQDPYTEYLKNLNQYFTARRTFESSRARYNSFKTLQAKETLTTDAKALLQTGRATLTQYTFYLAQNLERAAATNSRVKGEILTDLQTHNGYLTSIENVLSETPTFNDINTHSQALTTRYGYVKTTAEQALLYMDAVRTYDHITSQKTIIDDIENITRTLPDTLREKALAQTWINEARTENSKDEEDILTLLDNIYPQPTTGQGTAPKRAFEGATTQANPAKIAEITARLTNRTSKAQETFAIISEGYRKL